MTIAEAWKKLAEVVAKRLDELNEVDESENNLVAEGGKAAYNEIMMLMHEARGLKNFIGRIEAKLEQYYEQEDVEDEYLEGERMAYIESLEVLQLADDIYIYGLMYDIEARYPIVVERDSQIEIIHPKKRKKNKKDNEKNNEKNNKNNNKKNSKR